MKILCNECQHSKVCKFKQAYLDTVNGLTVDVPTPFDLTLTCPNYEANISSYYNYLNRNALSDCTTPCANNAYNLAVRSHSTADLSELTNLFEYNKPEEGPHQLTFEELGLE